VGEADEGPKRVHKSSRAYALNVQLCKVQFAHELLSFKEECKLLETEVRKSDLEFCLQVEDGFEDGLKRFN
jgi:hypothetical protein